MAARSSNVMRLFVALELPHEVRTALAAWAAAAAPAPMRRLPADDLHVTLAFLGSRTPQEAVAAAGVVDRLARPVGELAVEGSLWLPPRRPGVLAAGLRAGPGLAALHADLVAALADAVGFVAERRALRPHVTVARARREARLRPAEVDPPPPLAFACNALVVFQSHTTPGGARYEPLARAGIPSAPGG